MDRTLESQLKSSNNPNVNKASNRWLSIERKQNSKALRKQAEALMFRCNVGKSLLLKTLCSSSNSSIGELLIKLTEKVKHINLTDKFT